MIDVARITQAVAQTLAEDVGSGDMTAALIPEAQYVQAEVIAREPAVLCGMHWVNEIYRQLDPSVTLDWLKKDGDLLTPNQVFLRLSGPARAVLTGERAALNWLQTLSATATTTAQFVEKIQGTACHLLDTRKTLPGLRYAQKYAVLCGGGQNHRMGLYDAYLIKENHIASCGSIHAAVTQAKQHNPGKPIEVEVENLNELVEALREQVDTVMLDNFSLIDMKKAVELNETATKLEVSGNVTLETLADIAATGVDFISIGALTKHIHAIDLSMRVVELK